MITEHQLAPVQTPLLNIPRAPFALLTKFSVAVVLSLTCLMIVAIAPAAPQTTPLPLAQTRTVMHHAPQPMPEQFALSTTCSPFGSIVGCVEAIPADAAP